ncbi:PTH11-like G-protein-coupled receptor [Trichoderma cornu-damae]|uniref:PTH11-like G-protein-coupled receptor n=1 Tax=Trichoderma cornu-damae TaxID=654480 RepID=A0A9P8QP97_9HYPO|nr:PTH11-like G-protein-coupled receptor [Trichoderma cornu-damae]
MDPTLLIHWLFSILALLIMGVRLCGRKYARQPFNTGDYLTMAACVCALTRLGLIHIVLTWGTNNISAAERKVHHFTSQEIYRREVGSKLSVANRVFYNSYLWLQKLVLMDLYRRLILNLPYEKWLIRSYLFVLFATYAVVQVLTFSECRPFYLYWQVVPDPGPCAQAQLQLVVLGVLNIVTDFMLLVMPIPVIIKLKAPTARKAQLLTLFTLGIFIIAITIIRLPINSSHPYSQVNRTTWASTELLTAAIVVNAPTLYSFWNTRQREKPPPHEQGCCQHGDGSDRIAMETIGGSNFSHGGGAKRKPSGGIMQTKEVTVTEYRHSGEYIKLADELDHKSQHSS